MTRGLVGTAALAAVVVLAPLLAPTRGSAQEESKSPWIHIRVEEGGEDAGKVNVNLPLSLLRVAIDVAPDEALSKTKIHLHDHDLSIADLRRLWEEFKAVGDAEFVTVEKDDETVHIRREADRVVIDVEEAGHPATEETEAKNDTRVHIEVPVSLVDALLSGDGEELNLKDALAGLEEQRGEIVRVDDGETQIRIWIDEGR